MSSAEQRSFHIDSRGVKTTIQHRGELTVCGLAYISVDINFMINLNLLQSWLTMINPNESTATVISYQISNQIKHVIDLTSFSY